MDSPEKRMNFVKSLIHTHGCLCPSSLDVYDKDAEWIAALEEEMRKGVGIDEFWMYDHNIERMQKFDKRDIRTYFRHQLRTDHLKQKHCHLNAWIYSWLEEDLFRITEKVKKKDRRSRDTDYIKLITSGEHSLWYITWLLVVNDSDISCFTIDLWLHIFGNLRIVDRQQFILSSLLLLLHAPLKTQKGACDWAVALHIVLMIPMKIRDDISTLVPTVQHERMIYLRYGGLDMRTDMTTAHDDFLRHFNYGRQDTGIIFV